VKVCLSAWVDFCVENEALEPKKTTAY
jgi:hypothetical protein